MIQPAAASRSAPYPGDRLAAWPAANQPDSPGKRSAQLAEGCRLAGDGLPGGGAAAAQLGHRPWWRRHDHPVSAALGVLQGRRSLEGPRGVGRVGSGPPSTGLRDPVDAARSGDDTVSWPAPVCCDKAPPPRLSHAETLPACKTYLHGPCSDRRSLHSLCTRPRPPPCPLLAEANVGQRLSPLQGRGDWRARDVDLQRRRRARGGAPAGPQAAGRAGLRSLGLSCSACAPFRGRSECFEADPVAHCRRDAPWRAPPPPPPAVVVTPSPLLSPTRPALPRPRLHAGAQPQWCAACGGHQGAPRRPLAQGGAPRRSLRRARGRRTQPLLQPTCPAPCQRPAAPSPPRC